MAKQKEWYKKWWVITLIVVVGLIIIGSLLPDSNNNSQQTNTQSSENLEDNPPQLDAVVSTFESGSFCSKYSCKYDDGWELKAGGSYRTYDISLESTSVSITHQNNDITGAGIMLYDTTGVGLVDADYNLVYDFVEEISGQKTDDMKSFVESNIKVHASSLYETTPLKVGEYNLYVAKGLYEYMVGLKK